MINYVKGNALKPEGEGNKVIIHCCNDEGGWGSGFVLGISNKWQEPEQKYRDWHEAGSYNLTKFGDSFIHRHLGEYQARESEVTNPNVPFFLGQIQPVKVESDITVINMIGQRSTGILNLKVGDAIIKWPPVRYGCITECLYRVAAYCLENNMSVHAPRFCCGLAAGQWDIIEKIIEQTLIAAGVDVTIYDFEG